MRAAFIEEIRKVTVKDVPRPSIEGGGLLLQVKACAVCGTDVRIFNHGHSKVKFPWTTGHEMSGIVADIKGADDLGIKVGDRVNVDCTEGCGKCEYCRAGRPSLCPQTKAIGYYYPGAFAEYVAIPLSIVRSGGVYPLADDVDFPEGAIIEPIAAAINGHEQINVGLGDTVAIIGAGPLGYIHAMVSRLRGAARIIMFDMVERRLQYASTFNVDAAFDSSKVDAIAKVRELTGGRGADVVIVACSAPQACLDALKMVKTRGRVLFFAGLPKGSSELPIDLNLLHYSEISLYGSFGATRWSYDTAYKLVNSGAIPARKLVTHVFPLDQIAQAFEAAGSAEGLRVVVQP